MSSIFRLYVRQNNQFCSFELSWDNGGCRFAEIPYPESLTELYQDWQQAYFNFYSHRGLRGRGGGGSREIKRNWELILREAEAKFLKEFYDWLKSKELYEIRNVITKAVQKVDVFLTCSTDTLAKLPWETWDIFDREKIRLFRTSSDRDESYPRKRRKARILVIIGDETGLNFEKEKEDLRSLRKKADVEFVGWTSGKDIKALKTEIFEALEDSRGWDILFFAGHSNETALTGGMIAIAPDTYLHINDIREYLKIAKGNGLQFAIFNSCNGLSIADSLSGLGLSQVVVMREPIDNGAALVFAAKFLGELNQYKNIYDAFFNACQHLQLKEKSNHPSAYLVPSLFCCPNATPFRLQPSLGKQWLPTKAEAFILAGVLLLSSPFTFQELLLDIRFYVQARTRNFSQFVKGYTSNSDIKSPPVLFIAIDQESIDEAVNNGLFPNANPNPIDRQYLSQLIERLAELKAKVVGIDYLLDQNIQDEKTQNLNQSIKKAIQSQKNWFVLAINRSEDVEVHHKVASTQWMLEGDIKFMKWHLQLPPDLTCSGNCPIAYLLALSSQLSLLEDVPKPSLNSPSEFQDQLNQYIKKNPEQVNLLKQAYLPLGLNSVLDFSLNPDEVYQFISAKDFLKQQTQIEQSVVIIGTGGYEGTDDNYSAPLAVKYWCNFQENCDKKLSPNEKEFSLAYGHVYMVHHLLKQHRLIRIPDLWMIPLAALGGKWLSLMLVKMKSNQQKKLLAILGVSTVAYGIFSLYFYIFASILLPILYPIVCFWLYILFILRKKQNV